MGPVAGKAWPKPGGAEFARVASERTGGGDRGGAYVPQAKAEGAGGGAESRGQMTRRRSRYFLDPPAGAAAAPCAGAGNLRPPPCPTRPASKVTAPRGQGLPGGGGPERWRRRRRWSRSGCDGPDRVPRRPYPAAATFTGGSACRRAEWGTGADPPPPDPGSRSRKTPGRPSRAPLLGTPPRKEIVPALRSFEKQTNPAALGCLPNSPDFYLRTGACFPPGEILRRKCFSIFGCSSGQHGKPGLCGCT